MSTPAPEPVPEAVAVSIAELKEEVRFMHAEIHTLRERIIVLEARLDLP